MKVKDFIEELKKLDPDAEFEIIHSKQDWVVTDIMYTLEGATSRLNDEEEVLGIFMK